jgi:hypothetical protein
MRGTPRNFFCFISKLYGLFFFYENTVNGVTYLAMLQNWFPPQMSEDSQYVIFQHDGDSPHLHRDVRRFLNESLPQRWVGRVGKEDLALQFWPPRPPDLTPRD